MRSGLVIRGFVTLLALLAIGATPAAAADPVAYELPDATHGVPFGVGADGTVWSAISHGTAWDGPEGEVVGSLTPDGKFTETQIPDLEVLTLDPSGAIWGTEAGPYSYQDGPIRIVRLSPSGQVGATFTVGSGRGGITTMLATPGTLWFARERPYGRSSIERLSTADGSVQQFFLKPGGMASSLAAAPDGGVWFVEGGWGTVGRINPDGRIRRWVPTGQEAHPVSIAVGPGGMAWFGMSTRDRLGYEHDEIGRINRAGKVAEFPIPHGSSSQIAVGPEGRLWFQASFGGRYYPALDSIGTGGKIGEPICAAPTCGPEPVGLMTAPDGSLWYGLTQPNTNTGGGGSGLGIDMEIANQAGSVGHLALR